MVSKETAWPGWLVPALGQESGGGRKELPWAWRVSESSSDMRKDA